VPPNFKTKRTGRKNTFIDYESHEEVNMNAIDTFQVDYFLRVVDKALQSMQTRFGLTPWFEQYEAHCSNFGFLFSTTTLQNMSNDDILKSCKDLDLLLQTPTSRDVDGIDLYGEILLFKHYLSSNKLLDLNAAQAPNYIKDNAASFPNICIALRILLRMPVTVASAERSFSKLKLMKNYLRSTMSQLRLSGLAVISIEYDEVNQLDLNKIIQDFVTVKARKIAFS